MITAILEFTLGFAFGSFAVWWFMEGRWRYDEWQNRDED